jgi:Lon protease-like protein
MFPLGTVLFPYTLFPLHIFEPRYRALVETCLEGDNEFGTVLIERGHEVGGGDTRFGVGTVARMLRAERFEDGRYFVVAGGTQRFRVQEWLPDDPYPRARVERLEERPGPGAATRASEVAALAGRVVELRGTLGEGRPAPGPDPSSDLDDPVRSSYRSAAAAGLGPLDAQHLLEIDDLDARLTHLTTLLTETIEVLEFRLGS